MTSLVNPDLGGSTRTCDMSKLLILISFNLKNFLPRKASQTSSADNRACIILCI